MMTKLQQRSAQALTVLIHEIRPAWDEQGIYAALGKARDMGTLPEIATAAIKAALDPEAKTPGIIASQGPHWRTPPEATASQPIREDRCKVYGHSDTARTCRSCRGEYLVEGRWPAGTKHQEAVHRGTDSDDARTRAANDREEP
ncbi:hypothetical protein LQF12_02260 [Ruania suaedae]|uniref:hypothetical protein n=1 Tax=Ruania suaedae TaxID=2897774 RepID=UPI001E4D7D40|nr:hypothetical protein [Ruania suaedae]UFU03456.1 hypothetical protein LQF12_02260 [Ruania suaedae]